MSRLANIAACMSSPRKAPNYKCGHWCGFSTGSGIQEAHAYTPKQLYVVDVLIAEGGVRG